jgi:hypothetical protein
MHVSAMLGLFVMMFLGLNCDIFCLYFYKSFFLPLFGLVFYPDLTSIFFFPIILGKILLVFLCRIMSAISS